MAKKSRDSGAKKCQCDKCGLVAGGVPPGTLHRRCSGNAENNAIRAKSNKLPTNSRGRWN